MGKRSKGKSDGTGSTPPKKHWSNDVPVACRAHCFSTSSLTSSTTRKLEPSGLTFLCSTLFFVLLFLLPHPFYAITSPQPVKSSDPRTHHFAMQIEE